MHLSHYKPSPEASRSFSVSVGQCRLGAFKSCGIPSLIAGQQTCGSCLHNPVVLTEAAQLVYSRVRNERRSPTQIEATLWLEYQKSKSRRSWSAGAILPLADLHEVMERGGGICAYCQAALFEAFDHITSIRKGGLHVAANLCLCCRSCSSTRRNADAHAEKKANQ